MLRKQFLHIRISSVKTFELFEWKFFKSIKLFELSDLVNVVNEVLPNWVGSVSLVILAEL